MVLAVPAWAADPDVRPSAPAEAAGEAFAKDGHGGAVHRASGIVFPDVLGGFVRGNLNIYGPNDVGARYAKPGGGPAAPWVDLYVYRSPGTIEDEAANVEAQMAVAFGPVRKIRDLAPPSNAPEARGRLFAGRLRGVEVETAYMIARSGAWTLKARATERGSFDAEGWAAVQALLEAFSWSSGDRPAPAGVDSALLIMRGSVADLKP
jgi:hypothetical protein